MNIGLTTLGSRRTLAVSRPPDMRRRCRNPVSLCEEREFTSSQILRSWRPMLRCIVDCTNNILRYIDPRPNKLSFVRIGSNKIIMIYNV